MNWNWQPFIPTAQVGTTISPVGFSEPTAFGSPSIEVVINTVGFSEPTVFGSQSLEPVLNIQGFSSSTLLGQPVITSSVYIITMVGFSEPTVFGNAFVGEPSNAVFTPATGTRKLRKFNPRIPNRNYSSLRR